MKKYLLFFVCLLTFPNANCSFFDSDSEATQYLVVKEEKNKLIPIAKIVYKVSVARQEVVYWIEFPGKPRSQLYKLKNCIVADTKNWEGEAEVFPPWPPKVELVNGKFKNAGKDFRSVGWWTWYFKTDPKPEAILQNSTAEEFIWFTIGIIAVLSIICFFIFSKRAGNGLEKIEIDERDVDKDIKKFTREKREEFKKSGDIR